MLSSLLCTLSTLISMSKRILNLKYFYTPLLNIRRSSAMTTIGYFIFFASFVSVLGPSLFLFLFPPPELPGLSFLFVPDGLLAAGVEVWMLFRYLALLRSKPIETSCTALSHLLYFFLVYCFLCADFPRVVVRVQASCARAHESSMSMLMELS